MAGFNRFEMDPFDLNDVGEAVEMVLESITSPIGNITPSNEVESATIYSMALNDTTNQSSVPAPSVSNDTGDDTGDDEPKDDRGRRAVCSVYRDSVNVCQEYPSTRAAAKDHGVDPVFIRNAIWQGGLCEDLRWRYTDEVMRETATIHSDKKSFPGGRAVWSCDKDSGADVCRYENVPAAAKALSTTPDLIWVARRLKRATAGYRWRFDGDDIEMPDEEERAKEAARAEKRAARAEKQAVKAEKQVAKEAVDAEMEAAKEAVDAEMEAAKEAAKAEMEVAKEAAKEADKAEKQAVKEAVDAEMEAAIAIIEAEKKAAIAIIEAHKKAAIAKIEGIKAKK